VNEGSKVRGTLARWTETSRNWRCPYPYLPIWLRWVHDNRNYMLVTFC